MSGKNGKNRAAAVMLTGIIVLLLLFVFREWHEGSAADEGDSQTAESEEFTVGETSYGVFLGVESDDIEKLYAFETVVIDPQYFSAEDIRKLTEKGITVYGYLNVGALENFRDYYDAYSAYALGEYAEWEEEKWMDVSQSKWREFVIRLAEEITDKGVDGFFLDNFDVYDHYNEEEIYQGLIAVLEGIAPYSEKVLINGGDVFVSRYLQENQNPDLISGVNQEDVFTNYDFDRETYGLQDEENKAYYMEYLDAVKKAGLEVYLLEYRASAETEEEVSAFCKAHGYQYYNSYDIELT